MHTAFRLPLLIFALVACQPIAETGVEPAPPAGDACGASAYAHLVGQQATTLRTFTAPGPVRIFRSGDPITLDLREDRLNVELDARGRIVRIFCG